MTSRLLNRSTSLKVVPLNSGRTIILAPGETSTLVPQVEITGSDRIAKLVRRGEILILRQERDTSTGESPNQESNRGTISGLSE